MSFASSAPVDPAEDRLVESVAPVGTSPTAVTLADGSVRSLPGLSFAQLSELQWEQERAFALAIKDSASRSDERNRITALGYETVSAILAQRVAAGAAEGTLPATNFAMGQTDRYVRLVIDLLVRQQQHGIVFPRLFEIGFGPGLLLEAASDAGYEVAGIEVCSPMWQRARARLGDERNQHLHLGTLLDLEIDPERPYHVAYWNDVLEHIPADEVELYLQKIYDLLAPGGQLLTISPNWHARPSDISKDFLPPRSEAIGFHLQEYTLREVVALLHQAGFRDVSTPLIATPRGITFYGNGLAPVKRLFEPCLEWLPFQWTNLLCRGLGLDCTVATKPAR